MKHTKNLFHVLAGLALTLIPSYGGIIFSDNFDGSTANLNGAAPDAGAGTWVAAPCFDRNGDLNVTSASAGSATLGFTPVDGLIYTLEASVSLTAGGSGDWVGFGFANGQSTAASTAARFLDGNTPEGRAWVYARENTNNPRVCLTGSAATPWLVITNSPSNIDYRIVLDTTGGTGTWKATWFAKDSADPTYTQIGAETTLTDEDINSVGFCVSGSGVAADITSFILSDNQAPTAPLLVSTDPADDATGVSPDANLVATFDKLMQLGATGDITIKNLTTTTDTVISLPGPDEDGTLAVDGNQLTIDPTDVLGVPGDEIVIEISAGAIESTEAVAFAGLQESDDHNWSFTIDNIPPTPEYFHPITGTSTAPLDGALFIAFDEAPQIGTGNIGIYRVSDDSLVENIDVTSVTQNGARIAISPTVPLAYNTSYYVLIDNTAFTDILGNGYGITDPATWTFTTISNDSTVLFGDSFNRAADTDLNTSAGKYGSLGALTYTSNLIGVASVLLSDGQLLLESNESDGLSGPVVYPNHNFVDPEIESAGGFSVTVDLNVITATTATRYLSVALGRASADIDAQTSATASGTAATSDLVVAMRTNDTLWVYENGSNVTGTGLAGTPATPTKMRIDCSLTDFNATSTVNYEVFFDDSETAFYTGSFTWTGTDQNYISLSSNLLVTATEGERHALVDNLQIRTLGSGGGSGFDTWKTTNNAVGQNLDDDHDFDGVTNGIEYFIGGPNGDTTGFTPLPTVVNDAGTLSVTFTKAADYAGVYGANFVVETSATLAPPWTAEIPDPDPGFTVTFPSATEVKYTFPAGTKNFARLKVTGP